MSRNTKSIGVAFEDQYLNGAEIDNATIEGATVGATTAGAGTFTTLTATGKFGANGKTAVSAYATVAAPSTTLAVSGGFGFTTSAQLVSLVTAVTSILAALKANGTIAE
jgi:hypothetical protein